MSLFGGISSAFSSLSSGLSSFLTPGVSSALGSGLSFLGGMEQRDAQMALREDDRAWMTMMSNTAYQRAMADMRKAGLNPILAGKLGGASTPGLNTIQLHDYITPAVNTAFSGLQVGTEAELKEAQTELTEQQQDKVREETTKISQDYHLSMAQTDQVRKAIEKATAEINYIRARTNLTEAITAIPDLAADLVNGLRQAGQIQNESGLINRISALLESLAKGSHNVGRSIGKTIHGNPVESAPGYSKYGPILD